MCTDQSNLPASSEICLDKIKKKKSSFFKILSPEDTFKELDFKFQTNCCEEDGIPNNIFRFTALAVSSIVRGMKKNAEKSDVPTKVLEGIVYLQYS